MELVTYIIPLIIALAFFGLTVFAWVKLFAKAGVDWWKALIPIYNTVCLCRIATLSGWFTVLLFIPFINFFAFVYLFYRLGLQFSLDRAGIFFLSMIYTSAIVFWYLGFSEKRYIARRVSGDSSKKAMAILALVISLIIVALSPNMDYLDEDQAINKTFDFGTNETQI